MEVRFNDSGSQKCIDLEGAFSHHTEMSEIEQEIQEHCARNRELLKLIASKGDDAAVSRPIDLHFWASNESAAWKLSAALEQRGYFPVSTNRSIDDPSLWNVEASTKLRRRRRTCVRAPLDSKDFCPYSFPFRTPSLKLTVQRLVGSVGVEALPGRKV